TQTGVAVAEAEESAAAPVREAVQERDGARVEDGAEALEQRLELFATRGFERFCELEIAGERGGNARLHALLTEQLPSALGERVVFRARRVPHVEQQIGACRAQSLGEEVERLEPDGGNLGERPQVAQHLKIVGERRFRGDPVPIQLEAPLELFGDAM